MTNRKITSTISLIVLTILLAGAFYLGGMMYQKYFGQEKTEPVAEQSLQSQFTAGQEGQANKDNPSDQPLARDELAKIPIKRAESGTDYQRSNFSSGWAKWRSCNVRQKILARDVREAQFASNGCTVISGKLTDPYTGHELEMKTKSEVSKKIQIDHVVALSNAWKTGAKYLTSDMRKQLANDDLNLIAVSSQANQEKSDGDASVWLPSNIAFQCAYVARQVAVKVRYSLWVTQAEHDTMARVLGGCSDQRLPAE